ncbi:tyrosine-type recombinase/integrase [Corynebacterium glucuronolyticum]|uniref:tyrosine-type recombinase/integrase n=1 Tax=Corynebacterium glucuronolyticum TaxID=39791 RepID=UPI0002F47B7A|nr:site-specific integrase [Corynebacterium glucuronolyticum]QRO81962.1 site-specific integrase [Corynebacterium glucuronolyticum]
MARAKRRAARSPWGTEIKKRSYRSGTYFDVRYRRPDNGEWEKYPERFDSRGEALARAVFIRKEIDAGDWVSREEKEAREKQNQVTLNSFFEHYLEVHIVSKITERGYRISWDSRVHDSIGNLPVVKITSDDITAWYREMVATHDTAPFNAATYSLVSWVFNLAYEEHIINRSPCEVKNAGRRPQAADRTIPTVEELNSLIEHLPKHYKLAVRVAAYGALRIGEWTTLQRRDVLVTPGAPGELPDVTLWVRRGKKENVGQHKVEGKPSRYSGETKTKNQRKVSLPQWLGVELIEHLETMKDKNPQAIIFPNVRGGIISTDTCNNVIKRATKKAGLQHMSSHVLRHFGGTMFARAGGTVADIQARLGHSSIRAAMTYQHASEERDRALANRMSFEVPEGVASLDKKREEKQSDEQVEKKKGEGS